MKKINLLVLSCILLLMGSLFLISCQKEEKHVQSPVKSGTNVLKDVPVINCETGCIDPEDPVYYEKTDQAVILWGGAKKPKSKTVDIIYYNTETQFILKVRSSVGWNDLLIDSVSSWVSGPVPPDVWGTYAVDLPVGWEACDDYGYFLQVTGGGGPSASFNVEYPLIGICTALTVTDIDGNVYPTVTIGDQVWMAENLKTTHYNDGTPIPNVTDPDEWKNLITGAYCLYDNDTTKKEIYGALYNWYAVETNKLCPTGWHVPTRDEWLVLIDYLGGSGIAGGKLKSTGTLWVEPNNCATNEVGFNALPGGYRGGGFAYPTGFFDIGTRAVFWSSTSGSWSGEAYHNQLINTYCDCSINTYNPRYYKNAGESIRCIKN